MTSSGEDDREFQRQAPHMKNMGTLNDEEVAVVGGPPATQRLRKVDPTGLHAVYAVGTVMTFGPGKIPRGWELVEERFEEPVKKPYPPPATNWPKAQAPDGQDHPAWPTEIVCRKIREGGDLPVGTLMVFSLGKCPDGWEILDLPEARKEGVDPKKAWGDKKIPAASINPLVLLEEAHQMHIGEYKYGFANYVEDGKKLSAMTYVQAIVRHLLLWYGGEDIDPDSGVSHLAAVRAGCAIIRSQEIKGDLIDDRPDWGDVRAMVDTLDALWLEIMPKLDEQIKGMEK